MILQQIVYIDESGKGQNIFVSAAYMATAQRWERFSVEWRAVLAADPPIKYLKMSEAGAIPPQGQFERFSSDQIQQKIRALRLVIERHVLKAIWTAVPDAAFRSIYRGHISPSLKSPDYFAHGMTMFRVLNL